jgi:hypothetical protein
VLAHARALREAAYADARRTKMRLKEMHKATEVLQMQRIVAKVRLREADRRIGAIRGALSRLCIPEVSLSDDDGSFESDNGTVPEVPSSDTDCSV